MSYLPILFFFLFPCLTPSPLRVNQRDSGAQGLATQCGPCTRLNVTSTQRPSPSLTILTRISIYLTRVEPPIPTQVCIVQINPLLLIAKSLPPVFSTPGLAPQLRFASSRGVAIKSSRAWHVGYVTQLTLPAQMRSVCFDCLFPALWVPDSFWTRCGPVLTSPSLVVLIRRR